MGGLIKVTCIPNRKPETSSFKTYPKPNFSSTGLSPKILLKTVLLDAVQLGTFSFLAKYILKFRSFWRHALHVALIQTGRNEICCLILVSTQHARLPDGSVLIKNNLLTWQTCCREFGRVIRESTWMPCPTSAWPFPTCLDGLRPVRRVQRREDQSQCVSEHPALSNTTAHPVQTAEQFQASSSSSHAALQNRRSAYSGFQSEKKLD